MWIELERLEPDPVRPSVRILDSRLDRTGQTPLVPNLALVRTSEGTAIIIPTLNDNRITSALDRVGDTKAQKSLLQTYLCTKRKRYRYAPPDMRRDDVTGVDPHRLGERDEQWKPTEHTRRVSLHVPTNRVTIEQVNNRIHHCC